MANNVNIGSGKILISRPGQDLGSSNTRGTSFYYCIIGLDIEDVIMEILVIDMELLQDMISDFHQQPHIDQLVGFESDTSKETAAVIVFNF